MYLVNSNTLEKLISFSAEQHLLYDIAAAVRLNISVLKMTCLFFHLQYYNAVPPAFIGGLELTAPVSFELYVSAAQTH